MSTEIKIFQYQQNSVTFQLDNGDVMVNLTEMAKPFGKDPFGFLRTDQTQRFIEALEESLTPQICVIKTEVGKQGGTWAHQKLALKFAGWLDPRFELWVYDRIDELLRHGATVINPDDLLNPDFIIRLATELKQERESKKVIEAEKELYRAISDYQAKTIEEQEPRVLFSLSVESSKKSILIAELAKLLSQNGIEMGQNRLFTWLRDHGYLGSRGEYYNIPTQTSMEMGLFELKKTAINKPDGSILVSTTPKCTGKGQVYFVNKFLKTLQPVQP